MGGHPQIWYKFFVFFNNFFKKIINFFLKFSLKKLKIYIYIYKKNIVYFLMNSYSSKKWGE